MTMTPGPSGRPSPSRRVTPSRCQSYGPVGAPGAAGVPRETAPCMSARGDAESGEKQVLVTDRGAERRSGDPPGLR